MWTEILAGAGIAALGLAAIRIARPEYYAPKCCMGIARQIIKEYEAKEARHKAGNPNEAADAPGLESCPEDPCPPAPPKP